MGRGRVYSSNYPENPPQWYLVSGLHDAWITGVETLEFPFDYNKFAEEKSEYIRNLFVLKIDASGAIYDSKVREIRLFNYKVLSQGVTLRGRKRYGGLRID